MTKSIEKQADQYVKKNNITDTEDGLEKTLSRRAYIAGAKAREAQWQAVEQLKTENEKLKSLFSVQLDVMEQNNNMTTEITALKSKLAKAKETVQLVIDDASKPIEQISGYFIGEETLDQCKRTASEIGEG